LKTIYAVLEKAIEDTRYFQFACVAQPMKAGTDTTTEELPRSISKREP
jgi:hypothetical protein